MTFSDIYADRFEREMREAHGIEMPAEKISRLESEVRRLTDEKLMWKRRALAAEQVQP